MKKTIIAATLALGFFSANTAKAQLVDEQNVTVTMDMQPILQLGLNGSQNVDFVFDQISKYVGGITQYGATRLTVSSSVACDLYAIGMSSQSSSAATPFWDNAVKYGTTDPAASYNVPLTALELHQDKANAYNATGSGATKDYFTAFGAVIGNNNVAVSTTPYTKPALTYKYIAGGNGTGAGDYLPAGSYLVSNITGVGGASAYYYAIDYRLLPGLPAVFPNASLATTNGGNTPTADNLGLVAPATYYGAGVYAMNVKYVLMQN